MLVSPADVGVDRDRPSNVLIGIRHGKDRCEANCPRWPPGTALTLQQHVLGTPHPPAFRTLPAFAQGGRERYGIGPDTRARLDACLAESAADGPGALPLTARAARAYLDVCFFHPFDDGNARCALVALLLVLAREGVGLAGVSLLRRITVRADVPGEGAASPA